MNWSSAFPAEILRPVPKWLKLIIAVLLLPTCAGAAEALGRVLSVSGSADTMWVPLLAGAICWGVVYLLLPRPMWLYVVGHELTHVLWTWLFAGRVKKLRISSSGGHVIVTKTNFLIALAPYFFPLYAVLVLLLWGAIELISSSPALRAIFHLLLGAAYAFHITLTGHVLRTQQSDVTAHGYLFSAVVVFLGNATILILILPMLTGSTTCLTVLRWWYESTVRLWGQLLGVIS